jgi:hypothetical protein
VRHVVVSSLLLRAIPDYPVVTHSPKAFVSARLLDVMSWEVRIKFEMTIPPTGSTQRLRLYRVSAADYTIERFLLVCRQLPSSSPYTIFRIRFSGRKSSSYETIVLRPSCYSTSQQGDLELLRCGPTRLLGSLWERRFVVGFFEAP